MSTGAEHRDLVTVIKDVMLFVVGLGGIVFQTVSGNVNIALLVTFTAMVGVPGLTNAISLVRGFGTTSPPSPSATPESSTESGK